MYLCDSRRRKNLGTYAYCSPLLSNSEAFQLLRDYALFLGRKDDVFSLESLAVWLSCVVYLGLPLLDGGVKFPCGFAGSLKQVSTQAGRKKRGVKHKLRVDWFCPAPGKRYSGQCTATTCLGAPSTGALQLPHGKAYIVH